MEKQRTKPEKRMTLAILAACAVLLPSFFPAVATPSTGAIDRTVLPIPEPKHKPITEIDARKAKAPPRFQVKAPEGGPNVVIVLIDDIGFGHASAFGGPSQMPTLEQSGGEWPPLQPGPCYARRLGWRS